MPYNRFKNHRKSPRLRGWDYYRPGAYFVTINVKGGVCFLGEIKKRTMELSEIGKKVDSALVKLTQYFPNLHLDEYVVMPNHIHAIMFLMQRATTGRDDIDQAINTERSKKAEYYSKITPKKGSLSVIIRSYKASIKTWCNNNGYGNFKWQPRYHDRVIRSNQELKNIRKYIIDNPKNWDKDENYPLNVKRI